ncbi:MAG: hypothetical protein IPG08_09260 [Sphingobacteriaceae bacterium]|nr:hypothetical protein [Sphingobacteriaceae bacterium]
MLEKKKKKANAVKLYNTLLNSLSLELRTPIATIIGASDNLLNDKSNISEQNKEISVCHITSFFAT